MFISCLQLCFLHLCSLDVKGVREPCKTVDNTSADSCVLCLCRCLTGLVQISNWFEAVVLGRFSGNYFGFEVIVSVTLW